VADAGDDLVGGQLAVEGEEQVGAVGVLAVEDEGVGVGLGVAVAARVVADDEQVGSKTLGEGGGGGGREVAAPGEAEGGAGLAEVGLVVGLSEQLAAASADW